MASFTGRQRVLNISFALLPIIGSALISALLIMAVGKDPIAVLEKVIEGAFFGTERFSGVLNFWMPLLLAALGLTITFTAGLWNIGVEGQMMMGAVFATSIALFSADSPLPSPVLIGVEILAAMFGGMLWGALVGILKVKLGINEIFGGVALNALANVLSIYLISGPWQPPEGGSAQSTAPFPPAALLPEFSSAYPISLAMLVIVIAASIGVVLALRGTRWGLQLKATGRNARSALLLGVPTERVAMSAFIVCGALAGIAGSYRVLFTFDSLRPLASGGIGFLALLVVLLVGTRALWVPLVAFLFAVILGGSTRLKVALQLDQSLAGVLQGILVLLVLLTNGLRARLSARREASAETSGMEDSGISAATPRRTPPVEGAVTSHE
ncbi:MAG: ABC transporter permease [Candidatus Flexifilum sp.]